MNDIIISIFGIFVGFKYFYKLNIGYLKDDDTTNYNNINVNIIVGLR
jgi:hypothetical protein